MTRLGYQPALDGVRGIAIMLVVSWHAFGWPRGAAAGVDLFFVLSGFLITTLLLEERDRAGIVSLRHFYRRRALRLLPAVAVLLTTCGLVTTIFDREHGAEMVHAIVLTAAYTINLAKAQLWSLSPALAHMWSLAAEEQFYVVWPLVLLLVARRRMRVSIGLLCAAVAVGVAWRAALALHGATFARIYYAPDTHADALLVGCAFGIAFARGRLPRLLTDRRLRRCVTAASAAVVLALVLATTSLWTLYASPLITLLAVAGGLVVVSACLEAPRLLTMRPLVWLGRVSYSLYLWHLPILAALGATLARRGLAVSAVAVLASVAAAAASYYIVERPFLRRRSRPPAEASPAAAPAVA